MSLTQVIHKLFFTGLMILSITEMIGIKHAIAAQKCVQIYYDHAPKKNDIAYYNGRLYAISLQNLLGHFPAIQQYIIPVELYQKNQLERCEANFYLGTYYDNPVPKLFLSDFSTTKKTVVWVGYNSWQLPALAFNQMFGGDFLQLSQTDWKKKDSSGRPGIYNTFTYKGETFERCPFHYPVNSPEFLDHYTNDYLLGLVKLNSKAEEKNVVSWAKFTLGNEKTPYILHKQNHWYVADNPFSYICEGDRYFIFADTLFDILNEKPQEGGKKYALVRYEDVSPRQAPTNMTRLADMFSHHHIPYAISLIPIYLDPLGIYNFTSYMEMKDKPIFLDALNYAKQNGASFIMHSVTHQYDHQRNPFSGVSGEDFEFWNKETDSAIVEDSVPYVLGALTKGVGLIRRDNFPISAWMTAHYLASALDNIIFGQVFTWNVTRGNYHVSQVCGLKALPESLTYDRGRVNEVSDAARLKALSGLSVVLYGESEVNQIFPYPIYGDYYGRRVIPEDLGNIQTFLSNQVIAKRTVDDIIRDAKRYRVLRDTWASFFIHDILLNTKDRNGMGEYQGDTRELERLIEAVKADGYEFVNLEKWTAAHRGVRRPEPVEVGGPAGGCV